MSKARKLRRKGCTIIRRSCATYNWHGFTIQRGHYFWEDDFFFNVSAGLPGRRPGSIQIYRAIKSGIDTDYYKWFKTVLFTSYGDGKLLAERVEADGGCRVEPKPERVMRKPNNSAGELSFPTYVDKRPTVTSRLPRERVHKTYLDQMTKAAQTTKPCVNWKPAVAWKEA